MATILVVDDDAAVLRLLTSILADESGHAVISASNGREALNRLNTEAVDAVVCDVNMPIMDGIALVRAMRTDESLRDLPVVMISAMVQGGEVAPDLDVDLLLEKPFEVNALIACVSYVLGRVRAGQSSIRVTQRKASDSMQRMIRAGQRLGSAGDPATS